MVSIIPILCQKIMNRLIWPLDRTVTGTTTPGQKGTGSNGNEEVLYISSIFKTSVLQLDTV